MKKHTEDSLNPSESQSRSVNGDGPNVERILYGKSDFKRILNISASPRYADIYFLATDGSVQCSRQPNSLYLVTDNNVPFGRPLNGNLPLKNISVYNDYSSYNEARSRYRNSYAPRDGAEAFMVRNGFSYYKNLKPEELTVLSMDIETTGLNPQAEDAQVLLISTSFQVNGEVERKLFSVDEYDTDFDMLCAFSSYVVSLDPDVITGHNILGFDLDYMLHRGRLCLGRDGSDVRQEARQSHFRIDQQRGLEYKNVLCAGREIIDTMMLAYKHDIAAKKYDSYGLKKIIAAEGLEKKDREFYDASLIRTNWSDPAEREKIKRYAIDDADDALALYNLMSAPYFYMAQMIPKTYQAVVSSATGSQINAILCRAYLQDGHSLPMASEAVEYEGAISLGNPGIYSNVAKVDVASLYPSIMIEYQVGPGKKDPNGYFPQMVKTLTERRLEYKALGKTDKHYDHLQNAFKILINSAYGFLGTRGINFNAPDQAAFITEQGRAILQEAIKWADRKGYKLINADTDSISYSKGDQSAITEDEFKADLADLNALYPERIKWEDDGIFFRVAVIKAKNYVLFDGKKIKYKGNSLKATVKSKALQEFITRVVDSLIFNTGSLSEIYMEYVEEIKDIKEIKRWSTRKTVSEKVLDPSGAHQQAILDAMGDGDFSQGDRIRVFPLGDGKLGLEEDFKGEYDKKKLLETLYKTSVVFAPVVPEHKEIWPNFSLVKNYNALFGIVKPPKAPKAPAKRSVEGSKGIEV